MSRYTYRGDRLTAPELRDRPCQAVRTAAGKCIRGKNANMLVQFNNGAVHVVLARQLRKI